MIHAQNRIGIGTVSPNSNAIADITSTSKGLLIPRMTSQARGAISNPAEGLMVYDSSINRLYLYQDGQWRYALINNDWAGSQTRNWVYNGSDSIGIETSAPTERLDVNGKIRIRSDLNSNDNISAGGAVTAATMTATGKVNIGSNATISGNINVYGNVQLNNTGSTLQLEEGVIQKGFIQTVGENMRFGTNSSNSIGKIIFRMNGSDAFSIDRNANVDFLKKGANEGKLVIGWKLSRASAPDYNMMPIAFGRIDATASAGGSWMSPIYGTWTRLSTGKYEIYNQYGRISEKSCIIATATTNAWNSCVTTYVSPYKFRVDVFDRDGVRVDCGFSFVVNDPLNY